jgi:hypothetical protein
MNFDEVGFSIIQHIEDENTEIAECRRKIQDQYLKLQECYNKLHDFKLKYENAKQTGNNSDVEKYSVQIKQLNNMIQFRKKLIGWEKEHIIDCKEAIKEYIDIIRS